MTMKKQMIIDEAKRIRDSLKKNNNQGVDSEESISKKNEKSKPELRNGELIQRIHRVLVEISKH